MLLLFLLLNSMLPRTTTTAAPGGYNFEYMEGFEVSTSIFSKYNITKIYNWHKGTLQKRILALITIMKSECTV